MKVTRAIYWTLGSVQAVVEFVGALQRMVRKARKGILPLVDDTQPIPLTHRDSERIAEFGRRAGHEPTQRR